MGEHVNEIPHLEESQPVATSEQSINLSDRMTGMNDDQRGNSLTDSGIARGESSANDHLKFTRNIERFSNEVCSNKLLWTPSVLDFFEIPKKNRRVYETEREKASQRRKVE